MSITSGLFYVDVIIYACLIPDAGIVNILRLRQHGWYFADDSFICIFLNENIGIWNKISLKYVPDGLISNMAALAQIMAWDWTGDKPLSEPMMAYFTDAYMHHSVLMS